MPIPRQHSFLYILRPGGEPGECQRVGESNSAFPILWELLLADASPEDRAAIDRVLAGETRRYLVADADQGLQRAGACLEFLAAQSALAQIPGLMRYLTAARQHLAALVHEWRCEGEPSPLWLATMDEMGEEVLDVERCQLRSVAIERSIARGDLDATLAVLQFEQHRLHLTDWRAWSGVFGLALFAEPFFADAFRAPLDRDFNTTHPDSERVLDATHVLFADRHAIGVRDRQTGAIAVQPEWDDIQSAGVPALAWVKRLGRWGLMRLDSNGAQLCVAPTFDDVWSFVNDRAVVLQADRYGYVDTTGRCIAVANFDEAEDFNACGTARVRMRTGWGLLKADGAFAVRPRCERIEWLDCGAWLAHENGKVTLLRSNGAVWIAPRWSHLETALLDRYFYVQRQGRTGLLTWSGEVAIACEYECLTCIEAQIESDAEATYVVAQRNGRVGLLDTTGREILPFDFSAIEVLEAHIEPEATLRRPELLRVVSRPTKARPKAGIWNLSTREWVVPCEYDLIWLQLLPAPLQWGFFVANRVFEGGSTECRFKVGLLRPDGSAWFAPEYAWIGDCSILTRRDARDDVREAIYFGWSRGRPIQAQLFSERTGVWVYPDGSRTMCNPAELALIS